MGNAIRFALTLAVGYSIIRCAVSHGMRDYEESVKERAKRAAETK